MAKRAEHLFSFFSPGAIARSVAGLAVFALRHPLVFARLLLAGLRDRREFIRLLRLPIELEAIRLSPLFDREWYLRRHPGMARSRLSPELHYLLDRDPSGHFASPLFSGDEYLELNPEVRASGQNPLAHYELYGRFIGCPVSRENVPPAVPEFPAGAVERELDLADEPSTFGRTAVYATFLPDGRIPGRDILYLRGLREVCDNIVYVANSPLLPGEEEKLRGIASAALCRWHGGYDFGSYRIGLLAARKRGWLAPERCRELVFANSSCYAPVRPLAVMFQAMARRRRADFWGLTFNTQRSGAPHLQSFFLVFRRSILDTDALESFFASRPSQVSREEAINLFEIQLTAHLRSRGFVPDAFVRPLFPCLRHEFNPTTRPLDLLRRHKSPLVKVKVFSRESSQPPEQVLAYVERLNPELGATIRASMRA